MSQIADDVAEVSPIEVIRFNGDSAPDLGVIRMDDDDAAWWDLVARDAQDYEYDYGLDAADWDTTTVVAGDGHRDYDDVKVAAWVRAHIAPPEWRWHFMVPLPEDEQDDEAQWTLGTSVEPRPGWWRGAVITLICPKENM